MCFCTCRSNSTITHAILLCQSTHVWSSQVETQIAQPRSLFSSSGRPEFVRSSAANTPNSKNYVVIMLLAPSDLWVFLTWEAHHIVGYWQLATKSWYEGANPTKHLFGNTNKLQSSNTKILSRALELMQEPRTSIKCICLGRDPRNSISSGFLHLQFKLYRNMRFPAMSKHPCVELTSWNWNRATP